MATLQAVVQVKSDPVFQEFITKDGRHHKTQLAAIRQKVLSDAPDKVLLDFYKDPKGFECLENADQMLVISALTCRHVAEVTLALREFLKNQEPVLEGMVKGAWVGVIK